MNLPPLPPLPDPRFDGFKRGGLLLDDGFDADQLRTYAEQYGRLCADASAKAERAAVLRLIKRRWKGGYPQEVVDDLCAAIRARGTR